MLDTLLNYVLRLNMGLAIAAGLLGLARYRQLVPSLRWLALLAGFDAGSELTSTMLTAVFGFRNTMFLSPFIVTGEIVLQTLLYRQMLQSATFNRVVPWLLGIYCLYALLNSPFIATVTTTAIGLVIVSNLIQISLAGLYFQKLLNELQIENLRRDPFFWFSVSLAVYGLGNMLIYLFSNYILAHYSVDLQKIVMWGIRNLFNVQLYLAYILVLWARPVPGDAVETQPASSLRRYTDTLG
jgi:hypothetical protein